MWNKNQKKPETPITKIHAEKRPTHQVNKINSNMNIFLKTVININYLLKPLLSSGASAPHLELLYKFE